LQSEPVTECYRDFQQLPVFRGVRFSFRSRQTLQPAWSALLEPCRGVNSATAVVEDVNTDFHAFVADVDRMHLVRSRYNPFHSFTVLSQNEQRKAAISLLPPAHYLRPGS
jgi:hypothetical protein